MKQRITAIVLVAALLALLAGCGEKDEPPTTGPVVTETTTGPTTSPTTTNDTTNGQQATDEELIRATVTDFLVKPGDPSICDELITAKFLEASYGNRQGCIAARKPGALADQATVLARKPGPGNSTIVTVKPEGGVFAGQTLKVTIVKSGEVWKIDKISGDAKVGP